MEEHTSIKSFAYPWPSPLLFFASFWAEVIGTLIAVYGFSVTAIGWKYAQWIWAYALAWFLFNDAIKMAAYRFNLQRNRGAKK